MTTLTTAGGELRTLSGSLRGLFDLYVDSVNGVDTNPGTYVQPWKTLAKINAATLTPGKRIGLRRGSRWTEEINLPAGGATGNPVEIGAYGNGALPLIDGSAALTGWTTYVPPTTPQEVLVNGTFEAWTTPTSAPNSWARVQGGTSTTSRVASITGSGLYSLRLTGDASNNNVSINQTVTLVAGTDYTLSFKGLVSAAAKTVGVVLTIPAGTYAGYQLQPDGTWSTVTSTSIPLTSTTLTTVTRTFTMLDETTNVSVSIKRIGLTNAYAEIDDVSLLSGVPAIPPVNTFKSTQAARVWSVSRDDIPLQEGTSRDTLTAGQFKWIDGLLYVRDDSGLPASHVFEGGITRIHAVSILGKSHVRVRDVAARHIAGRAFRADEGSHDTVFQRITVRHAGNSDQIGSYAGVLAVRNSDDCMVLDCTVYGANNDGIHGWNATRMKVLRNIIGVCNGPSSDSVQIDGGYYYDSGLPRVDLDTEVAYNDCDQRGTNSPKGCIILIHDGTRAHHNICRGGNFQVALIGSRVRADHNTLVDNALGEAWGSAVQMVDGHTYDDMEVDHNLIVNPKVGIRTSAAGVGGNYRTDLREHHNTIVLTAASLGGIWHEIPVDGETLDNIVRGGTTAIDLLDSGLAPSGTWVSDRNVLGPERSDFLKSGATSYATLAAWRTATSKDVASSVVDPALAAVTYLPTAGLLTAGYGGDG